MTCHAAVSAFAVTREEEMLSTARHGARETETRHTPRRAGGGLGRERRQKTATRQPRVGHYYHSNHGFRAVVILELEPAFSRV